MFNTALIDFDGTICDTRSAISSCLTKTLEYLVLDSSKVTELISSGIDLKGTIYELTKESPENIEKLVLEYREHYNSEFGLHETRLFDGVETFFQELFDRNIAILVVSNKGIVAIENALKYFDIEKYVRGIVADTGKGGPKHAPHLCLQQVQGILGEGSMEGVLLIGDTVADIDFAKQVGIQVACVQYGYGCPSDFKKKAPDHLVSNLSDLLSLFYGFV
jgi:phosphoglycolate phosphatase